MSTPAHVRGDTTRTGLVIEHLERLRNGPDGQPRYRVYFTDGSVNDTMTGAPVAYAITNRAYRDVPLAVTFTAHRKIRRAVPENIIHAGERRAWTDSPIPDDALGRALGSQ